MISAARIARVVKRLTRRAATAGLMWKHFNGAFDRCAVKPSFSQCGEDMIAWFLLNHIGIIQPVYLDIGAHHPTKLSNTALFHLLGCKGLNIEPDPTLFAAFVRERPSDINLNIGVGLTPGTLTFYRMADPALNTFSQEEALRMQREENMAIVQRLDLPVRTIGEVVQAHGLRPDFVTVDVEGIDADIIASYDLARHRPAMFCVETITFSMKGTGQKNTRIAELFAERGYAVYADTHINTLFVDRARFGG